MGHLPGPYTIPNVHADVYCVYTNRTPATAMRGFGITGVDFAIEAHMDKVAETVGMNPVELRILNAYRDGDMKAHRRVAKNCALIECCQVVAEKAGIRISARGAQARPRCGMAAARGRSFRRTPRRTRRAASRASRPASYARKGGAPAPPPAQPGAPLRRLPPRAPQPAILRPPASRPRAAQSRRARPSRRPRPPAPARTGALRFSSLSGFRRR